MGFLSNQTKKIEKEKDERENIIDFITEKVYESTKTVLKTYEFLSIEDIKNAVIEGMRQVEEEISEQHSQEEAK